MKQKLAVLGSTGSIGRQTLDIVRRYPEYFEVVTLTSNNNWERLAEQAAEFVPDSVVIANGAFYEPLKRALSPLPVKVYAGSQAIEQVVEGSDIDTVVNALVGFAGLAPTLRALRAGKKLALANKESLVVAGNIVMRTALENNVPIIPVDSEHSAIFQCLAGEASSIHKLILTASGGPLIDIPASQFGEITPRQALDHPNWSMGPKITIDSATMMNKGFEVIEARWLFGIEADRIEVVVHPQSIIHSMVEFADGAIKAQMGTPDMHLPIQYALTYPHRLETGRPRFGFGSSYNLTFREPDTEKFPCLSMAYQALGAGGDRCCTLNAANEIAVQAFLDGVITFDRLPQVVEQTLAGCSQEECADMDDFRHSDARARAEANRVVGTMMR